MAGLLALIVFAVVVAVAAFYQLSRGSDGDQAHQLARRMSRPTDESADQAITRKTRPKDDNLLGALLARFNLIRKLEQSMWQAGIYVRVSEIVLIMTLLFGAGVAAGMAYGGDVLFGIAAGFGLSALPLLYIRVRQGRRLKAFSAQLPEVLDLLKSSLQAGHSLLRGFQVVVEEFPDPVSSEIRVVLEQTRLGVPLPRAFDDMLKRVPEESLHLLAVAIKVQAEVGNSLAEIINHLAETIRARQRVQLQIRALTAQPRLSGLIVGFLPVVLLILFSVIQPAYPAVLFHDPLGQTILKTAVVLDIVAFVIIRRILRLDF